MPRKSVYVKEEDQEVWEEAEKLAGESLSSFLAKTLRKFVEENKMREQDMQRIEVKIGGGFGDPTRNFSHVLSGLTTLDRPKVQAFKGRWLVQNMNPNVQDMALRGVASALGASENWSVALTTRGKIAVYLNSAKDGGHPIEVFKDLDEARKKGKLPDRVYDAAAATLGIPEVEELDI